jgi:hypothetical protein
LQESKGWIIIIALRSEVGKLANQAVLVLISAHFEGVRQHQEGQNDSRRRGSSIEQYLRQHVHETKETQTANSYRIQNSDPSPPNLDHKKEEKPPQTSNANP